MRWINGHYDFDERMFTVYCEVIRGIARLVEYTDELRCDGCGHVAAVREARQ